MFAETKSKSFFFVSSEKETRVGRDSNYSFDKQNSLKVLIFVDL